MNKIKFLLVVLLALCLVQVEVIKVPSRAPVYPYTMKYDAKHDVFLDSWRSFAPWCRTYLDSVAPSIVRTCMEPDEVPSKNEVVISLRDDLFKDDYWQYVTATVYVGRPRVPSRYTDESGNRHYVFDSTRLPFVPPRMEIVMHSGAQFEWDTRRVRIYSLRKTPSEGLANGYDFMRELAGQKTLDGTTLEYLLATPYLIPQECCGRMTLFLGTIYQDRTQACYCSALFCNGGKWMAMVHPLDYRMWATSVSAAAFV